MRLAERGEEEKIDDDVDARVSLCTCSRNSLHQLPPLPPLESSPPVPVNLKCLLREQFSLTSPSSSSSLIIILIIIGRRPFRFLIDNSVCVCLAKSCVCLCLASLPLFQAECVCVSTCYRRPSESSPVSWTLDNNNTNNNNNNTYDNNTFITWWASCCHHTSKVCSLHRSQHTHTHTSYHFGGKCTLLVICLTLRNLKSKESRCERCFSIHPTHTLVIR